MSEPRRDRAEARQVDRVSETDEVLNTRFFVTFMQDLCEQSALSDCIVWSFRGRGPQNLRELMRETVRESDSACDP